MLIAYSLVLCIARGRNRLMLAYIYCPTALGNRRAHPCPDIDQMETQNFAGTGAHGWTAAEVCHWPLAAWRILLTMWEGWVESGLLPEVWKHSRQVMLPKTEGVFSQLGWKTWGPSPYNLWCAESFPQLLPSARNPILASDSAHLHSWRLRRPRGRHRQCKHCR